MSHTRMVPRVRTRVGEIELECTCGDYLEYPTKDGEDDRPTRCECGTEWYVMEPVAPKKKATRGRKK